MAIKTHTLPKYLESRGVAIQHICVSHNVKYLYAIGSVLTPSFNPSSDIDLVYELDRASISDEAYLENLDSFISQLNKLFKGRRIDLIHYPSLKNPYFIAEVNETKVLLYEQNREEVSV